MVQTDSQMATSTHRGTDELYIKAKRGNGCVKQRLSHLTDNQVFSGDCF